MRSKDQWWNIDIIVECWCECRKQYIRQKDYALATCNYKNGKYLAIITYDSAIMCDEIIESCNEDAEVKGRNKF